MTKTEEANAIREHERLIRYTAQPFTRLGVPLDDLMQEGRIALLLACRTWRRESSLWTYARRFVMGAMFAAVGRALVVPIAEEDLSVDVVDGSPSPEDTRLVAELLAALTPEERQIVVCYFVGEATLPEVAAALGRTTGDPADDNRAQAAIQYKRDVAIKKMRAHADEAA